MQNINELLMIRQDLIRGLLKLVCPGVITCSGSTTSATQMRMTTSSWEGQICGVTSPQPTVEKVTMQKQNESNRDRCFPALSRCWIPQALQKDENFYNDVMVLHQTSPTVKDNSNDTSEEIHFQGNLFQDCVLAWWTGCQIQFAQNQRAPESILLSMSFKVTLLIALSFQPHCLY